MNEVLNFDDWMTKQCQQSAKHHYEFIKETNQGKDTPFFTTWDEWAELNPLQSAPWKTNYTNYLKCMNPGVGEVFKCMNHVKGYFYAMYLGDGCWSKAVTSVNEFIEFPDPIDYIPVLPKEGFKVLYYLLPYVLHLQPNLANNGEAPVKPKPITKVKPTPRRIINRQGQTT